MSANIPERQGPAFTLLELLLTILMIGLLVSLLLPALQQGRVRVKSVQCRSNLRQLGLGMLSFAQAHDDRFPVQVSTNQGGSLEFIEAGNAVRGEFYFAYKHFLPLAAEIHTPSLLVCPADNRLAARNFLFLRNTNLSYFVGASPQFGRPDSILSGDRNLTPVTHSIGLLRGDQQLTWTPEIHVRKGNVLFGDGHVELVNNLRSQPAQGAQAVTRVVIPSAPLPAVARPSPLLATTLDGVSGGPASHGGTATVSSGPRTNLPGAAQGVLTNLTINSGPPTLPPWPFTVAGPGGDAPSPAAASSARTLETSAPAPSTTVLEKSDEEQAQAAHQEVSEKGRELLRKGALAGSVVPRWFIVVLLLLTCLWLLLRVRNRRTTSDGNDEPAASSQPGSNEG